MQIVQIAAIGIIATIVIMVLKSQKPELAVQISIVTGVVIFMLIAAKLSAVIDLLESFAARAEIKPVFFTTILKITGIAYIAEFAGEVCRDAGENSIASKIELAGKVTIVILAVPIITSLLDLVIRIMP